MKNLMIGFFFGLTLGAIIVLWGTEVWRKELEETNIFLTEKLKEAKIDDQKSFV